MACYVEYYITDTMLLNLYIVKRNTHQQQKTTND